MGMVKTTGKWWDLLLVALLAVLAGVAEGMVYKAPPNPYIYWSICAIAVLIIAYFAFDRTPALALGMIPMFIVVQDAVSYLVMTSGGFPPTWYADYFPRSFLWEPLPVLNIPAFYVLFVGITLIIFIVVKRRARGAPDEGL